MKESSGFEETVEQDVQIFLSPACQKLYTDITIAKKKILDKKG